MVFPWTTLASPYLIGVGQTVVNTSGSPTTGSFTLVFNNGSATESLTSVGGWVAYIQSGLSTSYIEPQSCPTNVYELDATISLGATSD